MLRTVIHQIATNSGVAPKIASRVLYPAIVAVSARHAGSTKYWFSTKEKETFKAGNQAAHFKKKVDDNRFVGDHAFDPGEEYEKAAKLMEQAAEKSALGHDTVESEPLAAEQPSAEEILEIDLEHNEFITDHTFDVNDDKKAANLMEQAAEKTAFGHGTVKANR